MLRLCFSVRFNTFYRVFRYLEKEGLVISTMAEVPTVPYTSRGHQGTWKRRTRNVMLYSLTSEGFKEMFRLECQIKIALSCSINGEEV